MRWFKCTCLCWLLLACVTISEADEAANPEAKAADADEPLADLQASFKQKMTGATLVGHFTIDAPDSDLDELTEERYEIRSVSQMPDSDLWLFTTRIVYGEKDLTVPVPLQIKWAGNTPVITMDKITIPGMGTFGARVVIHETRYAGTWQHDDVGGHLFGRVEPRAEREPSSQ